MGNLFCPKCEIKIEGNFCSECGTEGASLNVKKRPPATNWREENDLGKIIKNPDVQVFIKRFSNESQRSISAEEFLKKMDTLFLPSTGVSLKKLTDVVVPIYTKLGIKTGKSKTEHFEYSIQEVLLKLLCSLVKHKYPLHEVQEVHNGILLIAGIPSSMKTFGGDIIISIEKLAAKTSVRVDAKIKGQLFDWGESKSVIKNLFADIDEITLDLV
mgnify:FL=1